MTINIYCDGGSRGNPGPAASAFVGFNEEGRVVAKFAKTLGVATNNVAEYKAVLMALTWAVGNWTGDVTFFLDSQLIVNQLTGKFRIKNKQLMKIVVEIKSLEESFSGKIRYKHVPREKNKIADTLVNRTLDAEDK